MRPEEEGEEEQGLQIEPIGLFIFCAGLIQIITWLTGIVKAIIGMPI